MKFITEEHLRDLYKKEPFATYYLNIGEKLTPGASQFLSDRKINICDVKDKKQIEEKPKVNWKKKKLLSKLNSQESLFLLTANEIKTTDVFTAQKVIELTRKFSVIKNAVEGNCTLESLNCQECTGINSSNFCEKLENCFEITDCYMHLDKSKVLFKLNYLKSSLEELEPILYEYEDLETETLEKILAYINSIINSLSQVICVVVGGNKCQRTI